MAIFHEKEEDCPICKRVGDKLFFYDVQKCMRCGWSGLAGDHFVAKCGADHNEGNSPPPPKILKLEPGKFERLVADIVRRRVERGKE